MIPSPDQDRTLELFGYEGCSYSGRVRRALQRMPGVDVSVLDIYRDRGAAARLERVTGRTTVPCLFVDGYPLFESADIVEWLERYHAWRTASAPRA